MSDFFKNHRDHAAFYKAVLDAIVEHTKGCNFANNDKINPQERGLLVRKN